MKHFKSIISLLFPCAAMLILILDSRTALQGAQEGLELCIRTVIPSLFPFFVISILLTDTLSGRRIPIRPISSFCNMPIGSERFLLVGILGGYPVGAKCIYEAWKHEQISKTDAQRLLGFCNNAGPAFIFGMCSVLFTKSYISWILWVIHILSALLVGNLLSQKQASQIRTSTPTCCSLVTAMGNAITAILSVCGWVVLFRVIVTFFQRWFMWLLPTTTRAIIEGILELANGCHSLAAVENEGIRFILCAGFLGFGGLCVGLQTVSVVGSLGTGMYFPGKVMQCGISVCLASLFAAFKYRICSPTLPVIITIALLLLVVFKKTVAFPKRVVYNVKKSWKGEYMCYSAKKSQNPAVIVPEEER